MTYEMRMKDIREESLAEGQAKGRTEGIAEDKLRVAKLMLSKASYSLQEIVELSDLSIDDIEKLKNDMHVEKQA